MVEFLIFLPCAVACGILRLRASAHSWHILPFSGKFHLIFPENKKETFTCLPNFLPLTYSASENWDDREGLFFILSDPLFFHGFDYAFMFLCTLIIIDPHQQ